MHFAVSKDKKTKCQKYKKTKRQKDKKDKKTEDKDQKESLILRRQGSFALLRCFYLIWRISTAMEDSENFLF